MRFFLSRIFLFSSATFLIALATDFLINRPSAAVESTPDSPTNTLLGLWSLYVLDENSPEAPVAFYYFHEGGIGVYRYGRTGLKNTNSFHWRLIEHNNEQLLVLRYNKTGQIQHSTISLENDESGARTLIMGNDQKKNGGTTRYIFIPAPENAVALFSPFQLSINSVNATNIDNRLWMNAQKFVTGGMQFSLYQLQPLQSEDAGFGWHHQGDFDDWSTEKLTYKIQKMNNQNPPSIQFHFQLKNELVKSDYRLQKRGESNHLILQIDPRNYWAESEFVDAGPSFIQ